MAPVGGEARVGVGALAVEGAAVIRQDARRFPAGAGRAVQQDVGPGDRAVEHRRQEVDRRAVVAVEVAAVGRHPRLHVIAVVPADMAESGVVGGSQVAAEADSLAVREPVLGDHRILAALRPKSAYLRRVEVEPPDALLDPLPRALVAEGEQVGARGRGVDVRDVAPLLVQHLDAAAGHVRCAPTANAGAARTARGTSPAGPRRRP